MKRLLYLTIDKNPDLPEELKKCSSAIEILEYLSKENFKDYSNKYLHFIWKLILCRVKVMVIGNERVGKTALIQALGKTWEPIGSPKLEGYILLS